MDKFHAAVCRAVSIASTSIDFARSPDGRKVRDILREALIDYADMQPVAAQQADEVKSFADLYRRNAAGIAEERAKLEAEALSAEAKNLAKRCCGRLLAGSEDYEALLRTIDRLAALAQRSQREPLSEELPQEIRVVIERLHTQNNRITESPIFAVQQKRRIYGLDAGYEDSFGWSHPDRDDLVIAGSPEFDELQQSWECVGNSRGEWSRVGFKDTWEFVTACLTEQGCKDYIARNGHNLREPRIYVYSSYRNAEWIALRQWLMSLVGHGSIKSAEGDHG